jgi:hypothetical protein
MAPSRPLRPVAHCSSIGRALLAGYCRSAPLRVPSRDYLVIPSHAQRAVDPYTSRPALIFARDVAIFRLSVNGPLSQLLFPFWLRT